MSRQYSGSFKRSPYHYLITISLLKTVMSGISLTDFDIWRIVPTLDFNFNFRNSLNNTLAGWDSMDRVIKQTRIFK